MQKGEGMLRTAETLLRTSGRDVLLRVPLPAIAGEEGEQLGLAEPQFHDVELDPCVFRKVGSTDELLVSAVAVQKAVGSLEFDSAHVLFATAAGVLVDGVLFLVGDVTALQSGDAAICYRVGLKPND